MPTSPHKSVRQRPPSSFAYALRALGKRDLPAVVQLETGTFRLTQTVKHDFYAATGFYESGKGERAVVKIGRVVDFAGIPLAWLGKFLCRREVRFYRRLQDLPNVPRVLGLIGETGFAHEYVEGHPLSKERPIPAGFFDKLDALFVELHRRGIAYVDTNKPQNILQGDDGEPHLIDFQISFDGHELLGGRNFVARAFLRQMQHEDRYHLLKHRRRLKPDEMTDEHWKLADDRSWFISVHRFVSVPYRKLRRRTFKRLRETGQLLPEGSK